MYLNGLRENAQEVQCFPMLILLFAFAFSAAIMLAGALLLGKGGALLRLSLPNLLKSRLEALPVQMGTLAPPLAFCFSGIYAGAPDMALGGALGAAVLLALPLASLPSVSAKALAALGVLALLPWVTAHDRALMGLDGAALAAGFGIFAVYFQRRGALFPLSAQKIYLKADAKPCAFCAAAYGLIGLALLFTASDLLIGSIPRLARVTGADILPIAIAAAGAAVALTGFLPVWAARREKDEEGAASLLITASAASGLLAPGLAALTNPFPTPALYGEIGWIWPAACLLAAGLAALKRR